MTTYLFIVILIIGSVFIFCGVSFSMMALLDNDDAGWGIGIVAFVLFLLLYGILTPSMEQMIENNYYAMMEDRPKCIDSEDVSLGCKKDYIEWQNDSIKKQHEYDSVKVKLENCIVKHVTISQNVKQDTSVSETIKTCIYKCWTNILNADVKKCQDECFK